MFKCYFHFLALFMILQPMVFGEPRRHQVKFTYLSVGCMYEIQSNTIFENTTCQGPNHSLCQSTCMVVMICKIYDGWFVIHGTHYIKVKGSRQTDGQLFYGVSIFISSILPSSGNMSGLIGQAAYGDVDMCMSGIFMDVESEI